MPGKDPLNKGEDLQNLPWWLFFGILALAFSLFHLMVDFYDGLFGRGPQRVSFSQAGLLLLIGLLYAWWGFSFAIAAVTGTRRAGLTSLFFIAVGWSFIGHGVVGVFTCLPPCAGTAPYGDIAHLGNLIFGGAAAYTTWNVMQTESSIEAREAPPASTDSEAA